MKTSILLFSNTPEWTSCTTIQQNLLASYELILTDYTVNLIDNSSLISRLTCLDKALISKPDQLILLDYRISPKVILTFLDSEYPDYFPEIIIHTYGDFILNINQWSYAHDINSKHRLKIVTSSHAQKSVTAQFMSTIDAIHVVPFPVDTRLFNNATENSEKVESEEVKMIYTGRLSRQKNILEMIISFKQALKINNKLQLNLVGDFDNIGLPYTKNYELDNSYSQKVLQEIKNEPSIIHTPSMTQQELHKLYNTSDCFISISTYNDEDYGMSVAESLCCGLPAVLTTWGGFKDFLKHPNTFSVNVLRGQYRPVPDTKNLFKLLAFNIDSVKQIKRHKFAKEMSDIYGIQAVSHQLKNVIASKKYITKLHLDKILMMAQKGYALSKVNIYSAYNDNYYKLYKGYYNE